MESRTAAPESEEEHSRGLACTLIEDTTGRLREEPSGVEDELSRSSW